MFWPLVPDAGAPVAIAAGAAETAAAVAQAPAEETAESAPAEVAETPEAKTESKIVKVEECEVRGAPAQRAVAPRRW